MPGKNQFTAAEQQQISIATPGLFERSNAFNVDFENFREKEYSFPLPVGKATLENNSILHIETKKGDAVKAMFDGYVRLSRKTEKYGNVIVIRHDNGLETVYAFNAENLVKVGQSVEAGQTIAIVGGKDAEVFSEVSVMINGARINPATLIELKSHKLRRQTMQFRKTGNRISVSVVGGKVASSSSEKKDKEFTLDPDEASDPFLKSTTFKLDLEKISASHWAYPLPGSKVISPYGGKRRHSGVDLKTRPNDKIVAAFDGVVIASGPFYGYGNCIRIKHAYGFETLYSHQSKNLVRKGEKVKAGQVIGLTGRTGRATTEHLHFEISFHGRRMNPAVVFDHGSKKLQRSTLTLTKGSGVKSKKNA
ncbi:peptidoglycan DD-metalloendopeptidase family protein [Segatella copri]|nr:peptidoglycan DD-metalloendopeptidase family protein [Segatella copri]